MPERELQITQFLCSRDMDSVDVGANVGDYSKEMAPNSRKVYAFEPVQKLFEALSKSRFAKRYDMIVYPYALSDKNGEAVMYIPRFINRFNKSYPLNAMASLNESLDVYFSQNSKGYLGENKVSVETRTLDSFNLENLGFIKIDVEGHEEEILRGAMKTISASHPHILVEIEERLNAGGHERVGDFMTRQGYLGFFIDEEGVLQPFEKFCVVDMQLDPLSKKHTLSPNIPGYINNFIFIHKTQLNIIESLI